MSEQTNRLTEDYPDQDAQHMSMYGITDAAMTTAFYRKRCRHSYACQYWTLTRKDPSVPWPNLAACLKFCDDGTLRGGQSHFGGRIDSTNGNERIVCVYTD